MKPQSLMLLSHRRRNLYRHCRVQALIPRRFYHHSNSCKNDNPRSENAGATTATPSTIDDDHHIASTIPKMGLGVKVGQYATTTRTYSSEQVDSFGRLIRDFNPLHSSSPSISGRDWWGANGSDEIEKLLELQQSTLQAAGIIRNQEEGKALVHGIFVSGIFSSIFAGIAPGCVYVNQGLEFRAPVFVEDVVVGCIHIEKIRDWNRRKGGVVAECQTRVYNLLSTDENKKSSYQNPNEAELVIQGRANVWLPIGHIQTKNED